MPQENRSPRSLTQMQLTILDRMMDLRRRGLRLRFIPSPRVATIPRSGLHLLEWVPELILTMEVCLSFTNPKHKQELQEVKAGNRQSTLVSSMNFEHFYLEWLDGPHDGPQMMEFERLDLEVHEQVEEGYLETSEAEDLDTFLEAHPELVVPYRHPDDPREVSFRWKGSPGSLVVQALVDEEGFWSRRYTSFPSTCYRLTAKGREAWAGASAQANTPSAVIALGENAWLELAYLMKELDIPKEKKGAFRKGLERYRNREGTSGYKENPSSDERGAPKWIYQLWAGREVARRLRQ